MTNSTSSRIRLTKQQVLHICKKAKESPTLSCKELAEWARVQFDLNGLPAKSTISRNLKRESALLSLSPECLKSNKSRSHHQLALDTNVVEFVKLCELEQISLNGHMIMAHAKYLAKLLRIPIAAARPQFRWARLRHLQSRYGIRWRRAFGESDSVDLKAANTRIQQLRQAIRLFHPCDVYNMDESAFFTTTCRGGRCASSSRQLSSKTKLVWPWRFVPTQTAVTNCPFCFLGSTAPCWLSSKPEHVHYSATERAWMTAEVFTAWLREFDDLMRSSRCHILLLIDNASSHNVGDL